MRTAVRRPQEKVLPAVRLPQTKGKPPWGQPFGAQRRRFSQSSVKSQTGPRFFLTHSKLSVGCRTETTGKLGKDNT